MQIHTFVHHTIPGKSVNSWVTQQYQPHDSDRWLCQSGLSTNIRSSNHYYMKAQPKLQDLVWWQTCTISHTAHTASSKQLIQSYHWCWLRLSWQLKHIHCFETYNGKWQIRVIKSTYTTFRHEFKDSEHPNKYEQRYFFISITKTTKDLYKI